MKVLIVFAAYIVAVSAKTHYAAPALAVGPAVALASTGTSSQFRSEDNYGNFNFGYDESHATGATSRREEETNGVRRGSYSLSDADGRQRIVTYIADANGFRATVQSNEPGVESKDPADVAINKAAPVAIVAAPAPVAISAPAPLPVGPVFQAQYSAPAPAPIAVKGYGPAVIGRAPVLAAPSYAGPAIVEAPRAFSYSFGAQHLAAPIAAPLAHLAGPAPVFQQRIEY